MKNQLCYLLFVLLLCCSCGKDNDDEPNDYISFVLKEIQVSTEAKAYTVEVSGKNEFTVSVDPAAAGWCRAEVKENTIVIHVDENLSGNERTAVITATAGKLTDRLTVIQQYSVTVTGQFEFKAFPDEKNRVSFSLFNCNSTIDWGDGKEEIFGDNDPDGKIKGHTYANRDERTIKITTRAKMIDEKATTITFIVDSFEGIFNAFHFEKYAYPIAITCVRLGLESLDVSNLEQLEYLDCSFNRLTAIDISKNTHLQRLFCSQNLLSGLDLNGHVALYDLDCSGNPLNQLDISKASNLAFLTCINNGLTALDISKNLELKELNCGHNSISSLDTRNHTHLERFICFTNQLKELHLSNSLRLQELNCSENQLVQLKVNFPELVKLNCLDNQLSSLDLSRCISLEELYCHSNQLSALDVSKNTKLKSLDCDRNNLTSLDVSNHGMLSYLSCNRNQLTSLDVSNTQLVKIYCTNNLLSTVALDALFESLPPATDSGYCRIYIQNNPGLKECDESIANSKNWAVYTWGM